MEVRATEPADHAPIRAFLCAQGWAHRLGDDAWFTHLLAHSRAAVAVADGEVIGFARGITDGLSNGYLSMVAVAPAHRNKGIGTALVRQVMGDDAAITWVLRAGRPGARAFFAQLGFAPSSEAMERRRR